MELTIDSMRLTRVRKAIPAILTMMNTTVNRPDARETTLVDVIALLISRYRRYNNPLHSPIDFNTEMWNKEIQ